MNKAAKIATFVAVAVFLFTFVFGGIFNNFLTQGIAFVILSISNRDQNFPIKGLQWIFYILGWVTGAFNLVFWFVVFILFAISDKNLPFFNNNLHKRVYYWGILNSIILFLLLPLAMFLVAIPS